MRVKLFTHGSDLDGISCAIVCMLAFGKENVDVEYVEYSNVNEKVREFWFSKECMNYSEMFITDISINDELANDINVIFNGSCCFAVPILLDHHKTAEHLNKYDWANVLVNDNFGEIEEQTCGTSLMLNYCYNSMIFTVEQWEVIHSYCEIVRKYDTWLWQTKYNDEMPKNYNNMFKFYGRKRWIDKVYNALSTTTPFKLDAKDYEILAINQEQIDKYIWVRNKNIVKCKMGEYIVGVVFAENNISEVGNEICKLNPDIDLCAIICGGEFVSFRTIKEVDVSVIARQLGGGGHSKASGTSVSRESKQQIINLALGL
jgi:oligoribonuclease NrnB/cAMP/cGMP phosphodiesterase (DHH superfamily)